MVSTGVRHSLPEPRPEWPVRRMDLPEGWSRNNHVQEKPGGQGRVGVLKGGHRWLSGSLRTGMTWVRQGEALGGPRESRTGEGLASRGQTWGWG